MVRWAVGQRGAGEPSTRVPTMCVGCGVGARGAFCCVCVRRLTIPMAIHSTELSGRCSTVTVRPPTTTMRRLSSSWNAEAVMCWSATKERLFWTKKQSAGNAYASTSVRSKDRGSYAASAESQRQLAHHDTATINLSSSAKKYTQLTLKSYPPTPFCVSFTIGAVRALSISAAPRNAACRPEDEAAV
eukprot:1460337-Prymnesium_polylepis.1